MMEVKRGLSGLIVVIIAAIVIAAVVLVVYIFLISGNAENFENCKSDRCFYDSALSTGDISVCFKIKSESMKFDCQNIASYAFPPGQGLE